MPATARLPDAGVSLVETVVAAGLFAVLLASVLPVMALVAQAEADTRARAAAETAATSHLERLRALPWHVLPDGTGVLDVISRIGDDGYTADGMGLSPAPAGTLDADSQGYVDVPSSLGTPGVPLTRRWEVRPHPVEASCRVLRVEVARTQTLTEGLPMSQAALARAQGLVCSAGVRP